MSFSTAERRPGENDAKRARMERANRASMVDYWWMGFCVRELSALFERTGE
jgi:hypothetical protein